MKIGRNNPCPCGSGKKYKQCCLINQNKDINSLIRETINNEGYEEEMANILCNLVRYIKEKQWSGACHATASILYVIFSELGYDVELYIGEVQKPGYPPFDHSWIKVDGKVIDIAVIMTILGGMPISDAVVLDKNVRTKQKYDIKYGITTGLGLGRDAQMVLNSSFVDYMDAYPGENEGLWSIIDKIYPVSKFDKANLREKYKNVKRKYVKE